MSPIVLVLVGISRPHLLDQALSKIKWQPLPERTSSGTTPHFFYKGLVVRALSIHSICSISSSTRRDITGTIPIRAPSLPGDRLFWRGGNSVPPLKSCSTLHGILQDSSGRGTMQLSVTEEHELSC